jgi:hypothetical protein
MANLGQSMTASVQARNVRSRLKPSLTERVGNDAFVPKGVASQPRCRETLSLYPMRDKQVISDGIILVVVKRRRQPRLATIMCFSTGAVGSPQAAGPLTTRWRL